jgi:DNA-binding MarR family transcriptional regulator
MDGRNNQDVERLRLLFRDIVHRTRSLARKRLGSIELSMTELLTLAVLEHADSITVGGLAGELDVAMASMSRILGRLERGRYVRRVRDRSDRRRTLVHITLKGRRLRERVGGFWIDMGQKMFSGFDEAEMEGLERDLTRIYENVVAEQREMGGSR